jgi:hypothetical protein
MNLLKVENEQQFRYLRKGMELLVVWNPEGEVWHKDMTGKSLYKIIEVKKASTKSPYPDKIILRKKGNIFFNFRNFLNKETKIIKEVYLIND